MTQVFQTDWLASRPVFYNDLIGKASYNIHDVIDLNNLEFHPEGFNNYLDFGYSILGQTPIKHVKFLPHSSRLTLDDNGRLEIETLEDPTEHWPDKPVHEDDIFHMLHTAVRDWEKSVEGEIIIPTSGGYDSRLLNFFIEDKSRIRSFTYGISQRQEDSVEVVYARHLSQILSTRWESIPLGDFHIYFDEWDKLFGVSTHAHGMYHLEFYHKIKSKVGAGHPLLSGIVGDAWAGSISYRQLNSSRDLSLIGYTHGLRAEIGQSQLRTDFELREAFWKNYQHQLKDERYQVIWLIRFKLILLSYLILLPEYLGFKPWSPFLCPEIVLAMLSLPQQRRQKRLWQKEFFQKHGLDIENRSLKANLTNELDWQALKRQPVPPLDVKLLSELVQPGYVEWINRNVDQASLHSLLEYMLRVRKLGGVLRRLGFKNKVMPAYNAYVVLKPIEKLLKRCNGITTSENPHS